MPMRTYLGAMGPIPQSEPLRPEQIKNAAGGFVWALDDWKRLDRFLVLGTEGGTYYVGERKLTVEAAGVVKRCIASDGPRTVARIVEISVDGRAPKNDPCIFALALAAKLGDPATRTAALAAVPRVCRIGTHLFSFVAVVEEIGGWGRGTRRAISNWYLDKSAVPLAHQLVKYQQREGWAHRDVLRKAHPKAKGVHNDLLHWAVKGWPDVGEMPHPDADLRLIWAVERLKRATKIMEVCKLIADYKLPRECVPTEWLNEKLVWTALLYGDDKRVTMPPTAMIRNLGKMTDVGLIAPMASAERDIVEALHDFERLQQARVHPMQLLLAMKTYAQGHGEKGQLSWTPSRSVVDALQDAFHGTFGSVEPTGARLLLALDISGSMDQNRIAGSSLTAREAAAAMALVTANVEPHYHFVGFTARGVTNWDGRNGRYEDGLTVLSISPKQRLDDVLRYTGSLPFGATDCALPMLYAAEKQIAVDTFIIYTDNESWAGRVHAAEALRRYRKVMGINAKLVVVALTATSYSIADPNDSGMLDVVGFDAATPQAISQFVLG